MSYPTVQGRAVEGTPYREAQPSLTPKFAGAMYQFYTTGTTTPANVYQNGTLTSPFPVTGQVVADSYGRFPPIWLDPSVTYRVRLYNAAGVQQWQVDPYISQLSTVGTSSLSAYGLQIAPTGEVTIDAPNSGGSGVTLTLKAGAIGTAALELGGTLAGNSNLIVNSSATTGAQAATFTATNKPGSATSGPAGWLPITCDGVQYYTPIWHGNPFTPYVANPSANGEAIVAQSVVFGGNGLTTATGGTASPGNWYSPTTGSIGSGYYINITKTSGLSGVNFTAAQGAWTNITSGGITVGSNAGSTLTGTYQLSTSAGGSPVVANGTITLSGGAGVQSPTYNGVQNLTLNGDGTATLNGASTSSWYSPTTAGVGAGYYVSFTPTGGTPGYTFTSLAPTNISAGGIAVGVTGSGSTSFYVTGTYVISSDIGGTVVLGSGNVTLSGTSGGSSVQSNNYSGSTPLNLAGNGSATLGGASASSWFSPNVANSGSGYWINITRTGGTGGVNFSAAQGSWTNITNSGLTVDMAGYTGDLGTVTVTGTYQISSSSGGMPVLGSGTISLSVVAGGTLTNTYTTSQTVTVPPGATNAQIELYGAGGGGGNCTVSSHPGGGAGSGGVCQTTQSVTAGNTLVLTIGTGGAHTTTGTNSTLVAGTQSLTTMTAQSGTFGSNATSTVNGSPGTGGACSGGNVGNVAGNNGVGSSAGAAKSGALGTGNQGGNGATTNGGTGATGGNGLCIIKWS